MARESREVWTKRVERWRDSGLSAGEFAAEIGVNANSLRAWSWRINAEPRRAVANPTTSAVESLQWVEVGATPPPARDAHCAATASTEKLDLVLASGMVVRVPAGFEPEALRRLLAVVG